MENVYICEKCKSVVWESDLESVKGDWCGDYYMGDEVACPHCGCQNLDEAVECPACGEYVVKSESYDDYCEKCVDKAATPENVIEYCDLEEESETVEINLAVYSMIKELHIDINDLLKEIVNESVYRDRFEKVCQETIKQELDIDYFMNWWKNRG